MRVKITVLVAIFSLFMLVLPASQAQEYTLEKLDIAFDIHSDDSVLQTNKFYFSVPVSNTSLNYSLAEIAKNIAVSDDSQNLPYALIKTNTGYNISVNIGKPTNTLTIEYLTEKAVFQSDTVKQFFTEFAFEKEIGNLTVEIKLPQGNIVYQNSSTPAGVDIKSDGTRIILAWHEINVNDQIVFSVKFIEVMQDFTLLLAVVIILAGVSVLLYFYFREKNREEFMKGFRQDEQKTIEYIRLQKTILQTDLQKEFHFSRAKATRIVANFEQKGLVKKQRYGRTNKITWIK
jgi:uncharacterized membrane protein